MSGSSQWFQQGVHLAHGMDEAIGEPGVHEAAVIGNLRRERERRDHVVHVRCERREPVETRVGAKARGRVLLHEDREVDRGNTEDDTRQVALDPREQRDGVAAQGQPLYPDAIAVLRIAYPVQRRLMSQIDCATAWTLSIRSWFGKPTPIGSPARRGPWRGWIGSATFSPSTVCNHAARNTRRSAVACPIAAPCTHSNHGRGSS